MPWALRLLQNPADEEQYYVFWNNGRLTPGGANPPPLLDETTLDDNLQAGKVPIASFAFGGRDDPFYAAQITDWSDIGGYTFTRFGQVFEFGSAAAIPIASQPVAFNYPYAGFRDFSLNPANPVTGWALGIEKGIYMIGGLSPPPMSFLADPVAWRFHVDWPSGRYLVLDRYGRRYHENGALSVDANLADGQNFGPYEITYTAEIGVGIKFYDGLNTGQGHGWQLGEFGYLHTLNNSELFINSESFVREGWTSYYTDLAILDNGTGADPVRLRLLTGYGETIVISNALPPTVSVQAPASPITNTTRPVISWIYGQEQGNALEEVSIRVFTQAQYSIGGFSPENSPSLWDYDAEGPLVREVRTKQIDVDLANGTYRAYVWVRSTGDLFNVTASYKQWTQSVTLPAVPTMAITPGDGLTPTAILLDAASVAAGGKYVLEYHDQDAPTDEWQYVEGGYLATPSTVTNEAHIEDGQARFGMARHYRARQVVPEPWLAGNYSAEQSVTADSEIWVLSDAEGDTPAVELRVRDFDHTRKVVAEEHWPDGRRSAVIIWGEIPVKGKSLTLKIWTLDRDETLALEELVFARHVLLLRDPYANGTFVAFSGDQNDTHLAAAPAELETTPGRDAHEIDLPVVQVSRPLVGPSSGSLALVGSGA